MELTRTTKNNCNIILRHLFFFALNRCVCKIEVRMTRKYHNQSLATDKPMVSQGRDIHHKKVSEYDQVIPQGNTADQPTAPRGRATKYLK